MVSTRGAKRRPVLPRRQSSGLSSTAVESNGRETEPASAGRGSVVARTVSPIPEVISKQDSSPSVKDNVSIPPELSAKAAGKRPVFRITLTDEEVDPPTPKDLKAKFDGASSSTDTLVNSALDHAKLPSARPGHTRATSAFARPVVTRESSAPLSSHAPPPMIRSHSLTGSERSRNSSGPPITQASFTTLATASTSNIAVQGTIADQSGIYSLPKSSYGLRAEANDTLPSRNSAVSLHETRFTPTQPGPSESLPLARSRSQLTLLLEREKERSGDKQRTKRRP